MFGIALLASNDGLDERLSTSTAFASLTIMSLIVGPLSLLMSAVPDLIGSFGCFERVQNFIDEADHTSHYDGNENLAGRGSSAARGDFVELTTTSTQRDTRIIARHTNFAINAGDTPILKDINITIKPRSLTIVAGKVGSGKTMLLRSLLGELHTEGFLQTPGAGAAYCAQTPWLTNSTIRRNILGQSPMMEEWYSTVVHASALDTDFAQFPAGDLAVIGSKGITLSGGQKQRVVSRLTISLCLVLTAYAQAFARAIYSRKPVMVIDDALSGLDWDTRSRVWNRVFGPVGLFRQQGTTVLLATHNCKCKLSSRTIG